jgi:hypothetical protein
LGHLELQLCKEPLKGKIGIGHAAGERMDVRPNTIGDLVVIGAMSLVNRDIPSNSRVWGIPAPSCGQFEEYKSSLENTEPLASLLGMVCPDEYGCVIGDELHGCRTTPLEVFNAFVESGRQVLCTRLDTKAVCR